MAGKKPIVLLVEPEARMATLYTDALRDDGFEVVVATDAQEALQCADAHCPDVVVLEMQMPQHNGLEFLYEFRSYSDWRDIPVIVHSMVPGHTFSESQRGTLGITDYLYKPTTNLRRLVEAANRVCVVAHS